MNKCSATPSGRLEEQFKQISRRTSARLIHFAGLCLFWWLASTCIASESLQLKPGLWEIRTLTIVPALSQRISNLATKCVAKAEVNPPTLLGDPRLCSISDEAIVENTMNWRLECTVPGRGLMLGRGIFQSQFERAEGATFMNFLHQKQEIEMISRWFGRRIGDCE